MLDISKLNFVYFFLVCNDVVKVIYKVVMEYQLFFYFSKVRELVFNYYFFFIFCWVLLVKWFIKIFLGDLYYLDVKYIRRQVYDFYYKNVYDDSDIVLRYDWVLKCLKCNL